MMWWLFSFAVANRCFDDAIDPADRLNITIDGISMPFTIGYGNWAGPRVTANVLQIFLAEQVGYNAEIQPGGSEGTSQAILDGSLHSAVELWPSYIKPGTFERLESESVVKPLAYTSIEGLYLRNDTLSTAIENGHFLDIYRAYDERWTPAAQYFDLTREVTGAGCEFPYYYAYQVQYAAEYVLHTGDEEGIERGEDGAVTGWRCDTGVAPGWWLAPACRADPATCIPTVSIWYYGWNMIPQWSFFHKLPIAFTRVAAPDEYVRFTNASETLFYNFGPDMELYKLAPKKILMPRTNPEEHAQKRFYSDVISKDLLRAINGRVAKTYEELAKTVQQFDLQSSEHNEILMSEKRSGEVDNAPSAEERAWAAACAWLRVNDKWTGWIVERARLLRCSPGTARLKVSYGARSQLVPESCLS